MAQDIAEGVELSTFYGMKITPADVARVLNAAKVRYVLAGAHAVNAHTGRPRATRDVDVLTDAPKKAAEAVLAAFPRLERGPDNDVVTRLLLDGEEAVDVMKARRSPLFRRVVRMSHRVTIDGVPVVVPPVEGMLAMKFSSMIFPGRRLLDRQQDAIDFARVLQAADELEVTVDLVRLRELGELAFSGGGAEVLRHVEDVRAGRMLRL